MPLSNAYKSFVFCCALLVVALGTRCASGQAALFLGEPYSYDGTFAGTGHTAVYLARVCAETPFQLRRCRAGEIGVVISRYHGIAGRDWIAVPLIPYLYAVRSPEDIPLYVNSKMVAFLREQYLSSMPLPAETHPGSEPRYELAGSAYDRTIYGFRIATRPEQDDALIQLLNSSPNEESYRLLKKNCADFAKRIINFYYPHAVHRSIIGDLGVTTPKQDARTLVHYAKRHREVQLTTFVIPQVPGLKPSKPVHGILESVFFQKKYVTPVLLFHPFVVATVETAYWAGWRFNPAKGAMVFNANAADPMKNFDPPLSVQERQKYETLVAVTRKANEVEDYPKWQRLQEQSTPQIDAQGHPFVHVKFDGQEVPLGVCRGNALRLSGSPELLQDLVLSRLEAELKVKKPRVSEKSVKSDWKLLESAREESEAALTHD